MYDYNARCLEAATLFKWEDKTVLRVETKKQLNKKFWTKVSPQSTLKILRQKFFKFLTFAAFFSDAKNVQVCLQKWIEHLHILLALKTIYCQLWTLISSAFEDKTSSFQIKVLGNSYVLLSNSIHTKNRQVSNCNSRDNGMHWTHQLVSSDSLAKYLNTRDTWLLGVKCNKW